MNSALSKPRNIFNVVSAQLMIVLEQVSCRGLALDLQNSFRHCVWQAVIYHLPGEDTKRPGRCHDSQVVTVHSSTSKNTMG